MRRVCPLIALLALVSCGGGGSSPTTPSPQPTPQANRAPTITSVTATPSFGIMGLSTFTFTVQASDLDGDPLTYSWNVGGNTSSSQTFGPMTFTNGVPNGQASVTVSDGKGGSASGQATFIVGSMTGQWVGAMPGFALAYSFTQSTLGTLTATFTAVGQVPVSGNLDPAAANTINTAGHVTFRSKVQTIGVNDYTITGDMDSTGTRFTGSVSGSGLNGTVVLVKQ
jgi:hypothetical protein